MSTTSAAKSELIRAIEALPDSMTREEALIALCQEAMLEQRVARARTGDAQWTPNEALPEKIDQWLAE